MYNTSKQGEPVVNDREDLAKNRLLYHDKSEVEWINAPHLIHYQLAMDLMEARVCKIIAGEAPECVWLVEHPPLYTAGTSAKPADLIDADRFPVYQTGRGGQFTYHGPGQRVAYVMLDLNKRLPDLRAFVCSLESWLIQTLAHMNIRGERREDRVGVWVRRPEKGEGAEDKIAAIGIRVRRWVTFHGISLNITPDLSHFSGIVPCGVTKYGVTSLDDLGVRLDMKTVDAILKDQFEAVFSPTRAPKNIS